MKRLACTIVILTAAGTTAIASAHHLATGATKRAILESLRYRHYGHTCAAESPTVVRCWRVTVSGNSWATAQDVGPGNNGAAEWTNVVHRIHRQWQYVGGWGEGIGFKCRRQKMPPTIAHDLKIYCG